MKFRNSNYETSVKKISDNIIELKLLTMGTEACTIRMDGDYLLTLIGELSALCINCVPFGMDFPLQSSYEFYSIFGFYHQCSSNVILRIERINVFKQKILYEIIIDGIEEFSELIDEFEEFMYDFMTKEEIEEFCEDADAFMATQTYRISNRT